ncbi:MAG: ATP-binding domain-containing protein [Deltaproteobacteria bacterium]|nr:ATP-binding domain-containing protein [Deltaproteobacteria bacterium]
MESVVPGSEAEQIIKDEQRLLARVVEALSKLSIQSTGAPDYDAALINLRDQLADAKPEDIAPLVEQMTRLSMIAQRYGKGRDLPIDPETPYFAHIRLTEDNKQRDVLVGKRGFIDRASNVSIVDWRNAPVSRIYYRYEEGDDYEEQFGDQIRSGRVDARRAVSVAHGRLRRIGCPQGTFFCEDQSGDWFTVENEQRSELAGGQGTAARPPVKRHRSRDGKLGQGAIQLRADKHLPEIAALIDPKQFDLITQPDSGLVVLQGGAGTGKTTVALHRIAYLNFAARKRFRPDRMVVIVPTIAMVRYIDNVLPSLGVAGVRVQTSQDWFEQTLTRVFPQAKRRIVDDAPPLIAQIKKHPVMLAAAKLYIDRQVASTEQQLRERLHGSDDGEVVLAVWQLSAGAPLSVRLRRLRYWLHNEAEISVLARQQADGLSKQLLRRSNDGFSDWAEMLTDRELLKQAIDSHPDATLSDREIGQFCRHCALQSEEKEESALDDDGAHIAVDGLDERKQTRAGTLDRADCAILLHLHLLKNGSIRPHQGDAVRYTHLVVDEAQDLSAIDLKVLLGTADDRKSVTLAGDTQQRLVFDNAFADWDALLKELGALPTTNTTLTLGYRSTAEVLELARGLLGELAHETQSEATRHGAPVEVHLLGGQGEAVALLADALRSLAVREPLASTALIARFPAQASMYADALRLAEVPNVRLVRNFNFSFKPGVEVVDVAQVKGLEFDYVVLLDVNASNYPQSIESRHLLHIAATRAAHQLWIIVTGKPSTVLPERFRP